METLVLLMFLQYSWQREAVGTIPLSTYLCSSAPWVWCLVGYDWTAGTDLRNSVDTTHDPLRA